MGSVFKVALPGYNAKKDTNPDHFALYVDNQVDYILIKEKTRQTVSVNGTVNIAHGLGYVPHCIVFAEISAGVWRKLFSSPLDSTGMWYEINGTNLVLRNTTGSAKTFSYYIFYDKVA